jgi:hypothetical protein
MTGYRRSRAARTPEQTLPPRRRSVKAERARQRLGMRWAAATDEVQRFAAMADHVRFVAKSAGRVDPVRAGHLLRGLIERLQAEASELEHIWEGKR